MEQKSCGTPARDLLKENVLTLPVPSTKRKLFEIISYPLKVIQVVPDDRLGNKAYLEVVNTIYSLYKEIGQRFVTNQKNQLLGYERNQPIYFEILYDEQITFNFVVREPDSVFLMNKLKSIFPMSTVMFRESDYIQDFEGAQLYSYNYEKHYLYSMNTAPDKSPLNSLLAIKKDINQGEKALFSMSITPLSKQTRTDMSDLWSNIKKGKDILSRKSLFAKIMEGFFDFVDSSLNILDEIVEIHPDVEVEKDKNQNRIRNMISELTSETRQKPNQDQFKCTFKTYAKTPDKNTAFSIAKSIETALKDMAGDNELVMDKKPTLFTKKKDKPIQRQETILKANANIVSALELSSLIRLPDGATQRRFRLPNIRTKYFRTPKELEEGNLRLGCIHKDGKALKRYIPEDRDIMCLPLFICTKMGGGKTTYLLNLCHDAILAKHGLVLFDYIRECTLGNALIKLHPECQVVRFDDPESLLTFGFPEITIEDTDSPYQRRLKANMIGDEIRFLLNALATDTEPLSRIMSQYLKSASKLVFVHNNKTLKDVYEVLVDEEVRDEYISLGIEQELFNSRSTEVRTLRELDEPSGARRVEGLLDRFSVITDDTLFQEMFEKPYNANINFVDIMDSSKPVVFLMPQHIFTNKLSKDVICTYYMSRIRLAMSRRKDFDKVAHVVVDELHQIPNAIDAVANTIAEPRKFSLNYIFTMHSFSQIQNKSTREKILDVGCNFMLLKGCSKSAFEELKPLVGEDFEFEDIGNMDYKFGALNLFSINNAYQPFICELPEALKDKNGNLYIN